MKWDAVPNNQDETNAHVFAIDRIDAVVCTYLNSLSFRYHVFIDMTEPVIPHAAQDDAFNCATPSATRADMRRVLNITK